MRHPVMTTSKLAVLSAIALLSACGGGSSGTATTVATTTTPTTTTPTTTTPTTTTPTTTTPTTTTPTTTGSGDCTAAGNIFAVVGNVAQLDSNIYTADGKSVAATQSNIYTVKSGGSFRGTSGLTEINTDSTSVYAATTAVAGSTVVANVKAYFTVGATDTLTYGTISTSTTFGISIAATSYFTPVRSTPSNPALATPYSTTNTTTTDVSGTSSVSAPITTVSTYSLEKVTVLAGTFDACKVKSETTTGGVTTVGYNWTVATGRLKGHLLQSTDAAGTKGMEARVLLLNGT